MAKKQKSKRKPVKKLKLYGKTLKVKTMSAKQLKDSLLEEMLKINQQDGFYEGGF